MNHLLIGPSSPPALPNGGDRNTRSLDQNDSGFADALDAKQPRRNTPRDEVQDEPPASRLASKLEGYLSGFDEPAADAMGVEDLEAVAAELTDDFDEVLVPVEEAEPEAFIADTGYADLNELIDKALPLAKAEMEPGADDSEEIDLAADLKAAPAKTEVLDAPEENQPVATVRTENAAIISLAAKGQPRTSNEPPSPASARNVPPVSPQAADRPIGENRPIEILAKADAPPADTGRLSPVTDTTRAASTESHTRAPDPVASRVNVLGFSSAVAPSPTQLPPLSGTASGVVSAMTSDPTWRAAAVDEAAAAANRGTLSSAGVNTLKIQLHPIELGVVTARLSTVGNQLSVEIQVESREALNKLSTETDAILKSLRAVGYDVEKISIQQSAPTSPSAQSTAQGRDQSFANEQSQRQNDTKSQGNSQGGQPQDSERGGHGSGETVTDRAGSSVYI
jgi:hypothetical protein